MGKLDLRKLLRAIATQIQDDNLDRLLSGRTVDGGVVAPRVVRSLVGAGRAKRVRILGIRVSVRDLAGNVGVKTGAALKDVTKRSNIKIGRVSFKIIPSPEVRARWLTFQAGSKHQVPRPTSGVSNERLKEANELLTGEARDQFVRAANSRVRG